MALTNSTPQPFSGFLGSPNGDDISRALADPQVGVTAGQTAVGAARASAVVLGTAWTQLGTVAASTGALLLPAVPGTARTVFNDGASPLTVYASGSDTIDGVAGVTGVPLANAKRCVFFCVAPGTWVSAQLGVVSA